VAWIRSPRALRRLIGLAVPCAVVVLAALTGVRVAVAAGAPTTWIRVHPGDDAQAKIDSCLRSGGGVVYFAPGIYVLPAHGDGTLRLPYVNAGTGRATPITLRGDGVDASILRAGQADTLLLIRGDRVTLEGLTLEGFGRNGAPAPGIVLGDDSDNHQPIGQQRVLSHFVMRDCLVRETGGPAFVARGRPDISIECTFERVAFLRNESDTLVKIGGGNTTLGFDDCEFTRFPVCAVVLDGADGIDFRRCVFEHEQGDNGAFVVAARTYDCRLDQCWFEDDADGPALRGLAATQWFVIDHCTFRRAGVDADSRAGRAVKCDAPSGLAAPAVTVRSPEVLVNSAGGVEMGAQAFVGDSSAVALNGGYVRGGGGAPRALRVRRAAP